MLGSGLIRVLCWAKVEFRAPCRRPVWPLYMALIKVLWALYRAVSFCSHCYPGHFQMSSYRYRSMIEGLYPYRSLLEALHPPKLPTCSFR